MIFLFDHVNVLEHIKNPHGIFLQMIVKNKTENVKNEKDGEKTEQCVR